MAEITETHIEREGEQAKVESWRLHVLIEAGFPLPLAERLAASDADLHTCVDLMRQGCAPATARQRSSSRGPSLRSATHRSAAELRACDAARASDERPRTRPASTLPG